MHDCTDGDVAILAGMVAKRRPAVSDWEALRYFLEARRQRSLSQAARCLGVDHTTVSRRIAALERSVGASLFDRTPRGWEPTPAGEALLSRAERVEEAVLALERSLLPGAEDRGSVRIATTQQVATSVIVPALPALRARHPGIVVELVADNRSQSLARREADLAVRFGRPRDAGLVARKLGALAHAFYGARAGRASGALDAEGPFIGYGEALAQLEHERWLDEVLPGRTVVFRANTFASVMAAARAGVGVALLPCFAADPDPGLVRLSSSLSPPTRELWLVVHGDLRRAVRIRTVMDWIVQSAEAMRASFAGELR